MKTKTIVFLFFFYNMKIQHMCENNIMKEWNKLFRYVLHEK